MILLIDNYDSFSYNLYQMVGAISSEIRVVRNDAASLDEIAETAPTHIIISPGPGRPEHAGISEGIIGRFAGVTPILGVCLGHQAICHVYGGRIGYAGRLIHGKASEIRLSADCPLFRGLPSVVQGARYHSLALERSTLPAELLITAESDDGEVMGVRHRTLPVFGVQFHPESVLTPQGEVILRNFINIESGSDTDMDTDMAAGSDTDMDMAAGSGTDMKTDAAAGSDTDMKTKAVTGICADGKIEKKNATFRQESEND